MDTVGEISLAEVTLTEDPSEEERIDKGEISLIMLGVSLYTILLACIVKYTFYFSETMQFSTSHLNT